MHLDFATKPRKQKTKTCIKGYNCGNSCINKGLKCRRKFNNQASSYAGWLKLQGGKTAKASPTRGASNKPKQNKIARSILDKAQDKRDNPLSQDENERIEDYALRKLYKAQTDAVKRIRKEHPNVTDREAESLVAYFNEEYAAMNSLMYARDLKFKNDVSVSKVTPINNIERDKIDTIRALNNGAVQALKKIGGTTNREIKAELGDRLDNWDGKYNRFVSISDRSSLNKFLKSHPTGEEIEYPSFTSTTVYDTLPDFQDESNIKISIKPSKKTKGVLLKYQGVNKDEGEILFPPGQKFKVKSITQVNNKYQIDLEEI